MNPEDLSDLKDYVDTLEDIIKSNMYNLSRGGSDDANDGLSAIREINKIIKKYYNREKVSE